MKKYSFGFIILRHVSTPSHDKLWRECYRCVRNLYPKHQIIIIDDNSNYKYVTNQEMLTDTVIIDSIYKKRGELLPYLYYAENNWFPKAVILHDSVFLQKPLDDINSVKYYRYLWEFDSRHANQPLDQEIMINALENNRRVKYIHRRHKMWKGCFGAMAIVDHRYIADINNRYNLKNLTMYINNRYNRQSFERVISCILCSRRRNQPSMYGNILHFCQWGITMNQYERFYKGRISLPIVKVWSSR